jgi:hypothetical protein
MAKQWKISMARRYYDNVLEIVKRKGAIKAP